MRYRAGNLGRQSTQTVKTTLITPLASRERPIAQTAGYTEPQSSRASERRVAPEARPTTAFTTTGAVPPREDTFSFPYIHNFRCVGSARRTYRYESPE